MGPLKIFFFLLANSTPCPPGEFGKNPFPKGLGLPGGGGIEELEPTDTDEWAILPPKAPGPTGSLLNMLIGGPDLSRTSRMLLGKLPLVGVAGKTLTEWWGLRVACSGVFDTEVDTDPLEEVELALLWL